MDGFRENQKEFIRNKRLTKKSQQRFRNINNNIFTGKVNRIALSAKDDKRIQLIDSIETYAYGIKKYLICKNEEIKCKNRIK